LCVLSIALSVASVLIASYSVASSLYAVLPIVLTIMRFDGTSIHSLLNIKRADEWKLENRAEGYKNMKRHLDDTSKAPTAVACICPEVRQKIQLLYVQSVAFNLLTALIHLPILYPMVAMILMINK